MFFADGHQARHFLLGNLNLFTSVIGKRNISHFIINFRICHRCHNVFNFSGAKIIIPDEIMVMKQNCLAIGLVDWSERWADKSWLADQLLLLTEKFLNIQFVFLQL